MPFQYTLFVILAPIATIISILTLVFAWRNRKAKGALRLSILITLIIGWLVFNTFELISGPEDTTLFWAKVTYLFISSVPVAWTAFAIQYTERGKFFAGRRIILLGIIPVITTILIWTNETQHLVWKEYHFSHIGNFTAFSVSYGWWFWINTAYIYIGNPWLIFNRQRVFLFISLISPTIRWVAPWCDNPSLSEFCLHLSPYSWSSEGLFAH